MGIIHDVSKLYPSEFIPYARYFYGKYPDNSEVPQITRQCYSWSGKTKQDVKRDFDVAWLHHQKANKHHWQYWILVYDNDIEKVVCLDIPLKYRKELLADWIGASKAINNGQNKVKEWYQNNRDNIMLHPNTREWIEQQLEHL